MQTRNWLKICASTLLIAAVSVAAAQQSESLLIGPGDMLHVQVFDTPELDQHVRVTDAGEITLVMGGTVHVASLTPARAGVLIEDALQNGRFLLRPRVDVTIDDYATQKTSVFGEVRSPGAYVITTARPLLDVLSLAGGLTELADRRVSIERQNSKTQVEFFVSNESHVALDTPVLVYPGDTVVVPKAGIAYVLGDVARPGGYTMTNNEATLSVLELVAHAGGTEHSAVPAHARLIRRTDHGYIDLPLHLSDMQKGKRADVPLQANDIVYVPFSYLRNLGTQAAGVAASVGSAAVYRF